MKTITVESAERGRSPLGARIRFLMDGPDGNMIHSTVPPGMTALPSWPGEDEAVIVDGPWVPHVDPEPGDQRSE